MPFCRRDSDDAEIHAGHEKQTPIPEWREPPGRLGEYVRRVKRLSGAPPSYRREPAG